MHKSCKASDHTQLNRSLVLTRHSSASCLITDICPPISQRRDLERPSDSYLWSSDRRSRHVASCGNCSLDASPLEPPRATLLNRPASGDLSRPSQPPSQPAALHLISCRAAPAGQCSTDARGHRLMAFQTGQPLSRDEIQSGVVRDGPVKRRLGLTGVKRATLIFRVNLNGTANSIVF